MSVTSLEQINEEWYKNLFRLLNSPKPEASAELKKICDDLTVLYEERGITEYFPNIPGESVQITGEGCSGSSDVVPTSTRKFEKPLAPIRKDSLAADRMSPHLSALRSNSPRLPSPADALLFSVASKPSPSIDLDQSQSDSDSVLHNASIDSVENLGCTASVSSGDILISSISSEMAKRKSSTETDTGLNPENGQTGKKREANRRARSDDNTQSPFDDEPVEKKPKLESVSSIVIQQPHIKPHIKVESSDAGDEDLDALSCMICKTFTLDAGNLMVECHECHNMYHQKCHQPNVPNSQINDPRMLWYCHQCEKKNQKRADTATTALKPTPSAATAARRNTAGPSIRDEKKAAAEEKSNAFSKRSTTLEEKEKQTVPVAASKPAVAADLLTKAQSFLEKHKKKAVPSPPQKTTGSAGNTNPFAMALSSAASSTGSAKLATSTATGGLSKLASTVQQQSASANSLKPVASSTSTTSPSLSAASAAAKQLQTSSAQMQAAEKRLLMMKKKAAMKGSYKI